MVSYQLLSVLTVRSSTSYCMRHGSDLSNRFKSSPIYKYGPFSETLAVTGLLSQPFNSQIDFSSSEF